MAAPYQIGIVRRPIYGSIEALKASDVKVANQAVLVAAPISADKGKDEAQGRLCSTARHPHQQTHQKNSGRGNTSISATSIRQQEPQDCASSHFTDVALFHRESAQQFRSVALE
eukprot:scaffold3813_cov151-Pinguiococcus_pyrenoidosus.AAC.3